MSELSVSRSEVAKRATRRSRKVVDDAELGKCSVYFMHSHGHKGTLRPCHDTAPHASGYLTDKQVVELRNLVQTKMLKMMHKNGGG